MEIKPIIIGLIFQTKMFCECLLSFFNQNHDGKYRCSNISNGQPVNEKIDFVLLEVGSDDEYQTDGIASIKEKIADVKKRLKAEVIVIGSAKDEPLLKMCIMVGAYTFSLKENGLDDLLKTIGWAREGLCRRNIIDYDVVRKTSMPSISVSSLTEREKEVLALLIEKLPNKQIAKKLHISLSTAKNHVQSIFRKLGIKGRHNLLKQVDVLVTDSALE